MFDGQFEKGLKYARKIESEITLDDLKSLEVTAPASKFMEAYKATTLHLLIRFGKWDLILQEAIPSDDELEPAMIASTHYARGLAFAAKGLVKEAEEEQGKFLNALKIPALKDYMLHVNFLLANEHAAVGIFDVAVAMLAGELEYRKGNYKKAFEQLRHAVYLDDHLHYDEPWGWMVPTRHALGALLLEQNHVEEAIEVFQKDLKKNIDNLWALTGLYECYSKLKLPQKAEAVKAQLDRASQRADFAIGSACFCANGPLACCT